MAHIAAPSVSDWLIGKPNSSKLIGCIINSPLGGAREGASYRKSAQECDRKAEWQKHLTKVDPAFHHHHHTSLGCVVSEYSIVCIDSARIERHTSTLFHRRGGLLLLRLLPSLRLILSSSYNDG